MSRHFPQKETKGYGSNDMASRHILSINLCYKNSMHYLVILVTLLFLLYGTSSYNI